MGRKPSPFKENSEHNKGLDNVKKYDERAKKGEGYMRFIKSRNQYAYTIRYDDVASNQRKSKTFYGISEAVCRKKSEAFLDDINRPPSLAEKTIPEIIKKDLDDKLAINAISTGYTRDIDTLKIIENNKRFSSLIIRKITQDDIMAFFTSGICEEYSQSVLKKLKNMISRAFELAIDDGNMPSSKNPMKAKIFGKIKSAKPTKKVCSFTMDERCRLISAVLEYKPKANARDFRIPILIELTTGLRMGEVLALTKDDINLKTGTVSVSKTISRGVEYIPVIKPPKTQKGHRTVPLSNLAKEVLTKALEIDVDNKDNLIFYNYSKSRPVTTSEVNLVLKTIERNNDLPEYSTHSLRHTFASHALRSGVSVAVIKEWLGHENIETTVDTYIDILNELEAESVDLLNSHNQGIKIEFKGA